MDKPPNHRSYRLPLRGMGLLFQVLALAAFAGWLTQAQDLEALGNTLMQFGVLLILIRQQAG